MQCVGLPRRYSSALERREGSREGEALADPRQHPRLRRRPPQARVVAAPRPRLEVPARPPRRRPRKRRRLHMEPRKAIGVSYPNDYLFLSGSLLLRCGRSAFFLTKKSICISSSHTLFRSTFTVSDRARHRIDRHFGGCLFHCTID